MNENNFEKFDKEKLNGLLGAVSSKLGVPPEQLKKELEEGKFDSALNSLSGKDAALFRQAVGDPKLIERLMSTPQAKALYKKLGGGK